MSKKRVLGILSIGLLILITITYAQNDGAKPMGSTDAQQAQDVSNQSPEAKAANEGVSMTEEGNVSLDFREADIRNVLQVLAYRSGMNIVTSPEVTGTITIQLSNVPWQQALDVILQTYGYAYERKGSILSVTSIENMKKRREDAALLADQPLVARWLELMQTGAAEH